MDATARARKAGSGGRWTVLAAALLCGCGDGTASPPAMDLAVAAPPDLCLGECCTSADCVGNAKGPRCDAETHKCTFCTSDPDDCPVGSFCWRTNGVWGCAKACSRDGDCEKGLFCCIGHCTDIATDSESCGACDNPCALPDAVAKCDKALCAVGMCSVGHEDCNQDPKDGCESTPINDPKNCGECGKVCPMGTACNFNRCE